MMDLDETHEWEGYWWLVGEEDDDVCGQLTYEPETFIELDTLGSLGSLETGNGDPFRGEERTVHGFGANGDEVTLARAVVQPAQFSVPGIQKWRAVGFLAIIGRNIGPPVDPEYLDSVARFTGLEEWLGQRSVDIELPRDRRGDGHSASIEHELPEPIEIEVDPIDGVLEFRLESTITPGGWSASIEGKASVKLEPSSPKPLSWFRSQVRLLRLFLALLTGETVSLRSLSCTFEREEHGDDAVVPHRDDVLPAFEPRGDDTDIHRHFMPMSRDQLGGRLEDALNAWYARAETMKPLTDLYFDIRYDATKFVNFRLLALTQGLEGYHRNALGGGYMARDEWEEILEPIVDAIPDEIGDDHRQALKSRLEWGYEYSLRYRLRELLQELSDNEQQLVCSDPVAFVDDVVNARNAYTHYGGDESGTGNYDINELNALVHRLEALSEIILFHEIGIEGEELIDALTRVNRYEPVDE